jgi:ParB-like chromosome segregation protein Spo0J
MAKAPMTSEKAAARLGFSLASVTRSLSILKLPEDLLGLVANGEITADAAYMLSRVEDPAEQKRLAADVCGGRLSRDALARKLKASRRSNERKGEGIARHTALLGGGCSVTFVGAGLSLDKAIDWLEQLLARARKAKSQGLTLETFVRALRDQAAEGKGGKS